MTRDDALATLAERRFDVLIVGGGIIGAGIAAEAAHAGLAVALVERGDFGGATSSASSKLIHGGLRYLRLGDLRLVRESHAERRALMTVVAPHLVRKLPFLFPLYHDGPYRPFTVQAGLWLYSTLARDRLGGFVRPERARRSVPALRIDDLRGCGIYWDAWTNDSRLCLATLRAAENAGAVLASRADVQALRIAGGRAAGAEVRDLVGGGQLSVQARAVVNATGPWIDAIRRLEDPAAGTSSRLSKGVHVMVSPAEPWSAALTIPHDKVRVSFAVPWEGMLMLGTTDTLYEGDPGAVEASDEDVRQILDEASLAVESSLLARDRVRAVFAGLRVLPGTGPDTASTKRETVLMRGPARMLTVAGGKLTTYRRIALDALGELRGDLGLPRLARSPRPLPGASDLTEATARLGRRYPTLEPTVRIHLAHLYGSLAEEVLAPADERPELLERLHPDAPDLAAQAVYAAKREWALAADDVLRRRTTLALRGLATPELEARVDELLGRESERRALA
ncbi:MAG TPA: glycerol-3-phosphate dehydrogenase/oxidase [Gaiellaceae bacterium]|jgi:glycerol-3-phosphate dehydrogenase